MQKGFWKHCLMGAAGGVAVNYLAAVLLSYALRLGYFMPFPAALPEQVGGEMNAVMLELALCTLLGAGAGAAWHILRQRQWRIGKKLCCSAAAVTGFLTPAAVLAAGMLK